MATCHPPKLHAQENRHGERDALELLEKLPPKAHVLMNLVVRDPQDRKQCEIDFLVLHEDLGVLVIEVKGGRLRVRDGQWEGVKGEESRPCPNPLEQADRQAFILQRALQEALGWSPVCTRATLWPHMPDAEVKALGPSLPNYAILTASRMAHPLEALQRAVSRGEAWETYRMSPEAGHHALSGDRLTALLEWLAPTFVPHQTLAQAIEAEGRHRDEAAGLVLETLAEGFALGRYRVSGPAGSGKSLLGRYVARIWGLQGRKVLYVAYNKALVYATQQTFGSDDWLDIATFHDFAEVQLDEIDALPLDRKGTSPWYEEDLPRALADHAYLLPSLYDALVVDEAQDLEPAWVATLVRRLRHPEHDPVLLLQDPGQCLFRTVEHTLGQPWRLSRVLRQPPALWRAAWEAHPGCGWPEPPPVEDADAYRSHRSAPGTWRKDLDRVLEGLASEGFTPDQVLVLSPHRPLTLGIEDGGRIGPWRANTQKDCWEDPEAVLVGSVPAYKGLERDVVVYLAPAYKHPKAGLLRHVALSRAKALGLVLEKALADPHAAEAPPQVRAAAEAEPPRPPSVKPSLQPEQRAMLIKLLKEAKP